MMPDDTTQGLLAFLSQQADVLGSVGFDDEKGIPFIFQPAIDSINQPRPYIDMEGTGTAAIVVSQQGSWTSPNLYNTLKFPRIRIDIWSDSPRDSMGHVTRETEARTRIYNIDNILDTYLHRPDGESVAWRNVVSVSCVRLTEVSIVQSKESNKVLIGTALFAASVLLPPPQ